MGNKQYFIFVPVSCVFPFKDGVVVRGPRGPGEGLHAGGEARSVHQAGQEADRLHPAEHPEVTGQAADPGVTRVTGTGQGQGHPRRPSQAGGGVR
jgi:hypothetical protein